jgi:hypothetical protein
MISKEKIVKFCAQKNTFEYNADKAIEEAIEFSEVVIELRTKHKGNPKRPDKVEAIKEYGDFFYRGLIYLMALNPAKTMNEILAEVADHIELKLDKLEQYKKEGKYKGGL